MVLAAAFDASSYFKMHFCIFISFFLIWAVVVFAAYFCWFFCNFFSFFNFYLKKDTLFSAVVNVYAYASTFFFSFFFFKNDGVRSPFFFFLSFFGDPSVDISC